MKLFNIHNTENFYKVIDACKAPVLVSASDGRSEDFRNNRAMASRRSSCTPPAPKT